MVKKKEESPKELKIWYKGDPEAEVFMVDGREELYELVKGGFEDGYLYFLNEDYETVFINIDDVSVVKYEDD